MYYLFIFIGRKYAKSVLRNWLLLLYLEMNASVNSTSALSWAVFKNMVKDNISLEAIYHYHYRFFEIPYPSNPLALPLACVFPSSVLRFGGQSPLSILRGVYVRPGGGFVRSIFVRLLWLFEVWTAARVLRCVIRMDVCCLLNCS